jgi:protein subunit release factor A
MALPEHLERLARDCEITAFKSSGPGGQKKNKTESSVRVVHGPTGITRIATESRSQTRNKESALERVWLEIQRRARKRKPRIATRPTQAAKDRRIQEKKRAGTIKRLRRTTDED